MRHVMLLACLLATTIIAPPTTEAKPPPPAPVHPVVDDYFGTKVVDNYRYMEDLKNPEVQKWMKTQADYTRATLDALPGRSTLRSSLSEMFQSTSAVVGGLQIVDKHYYTLRLPSGAQQRKLCVRNGVDGTDRVLVDPEKLEGGKDAHLSIGYFSPARDNRYVVYSLAAGGSEEGVWHILDTRTGKNLAETADRAGLDQPAWRADGRSFFYIRNQKLTSDMPATAKYENARVYLHVVGRSFDLDPAVVGRGLSVTLPLTASEYPYVSALPDSGYAVALVSPGTETRMRAYAAPIAAIDGGKTPWRAIASSYEDEFIGLYGADTPSIGSHGDTLYWLSRKRAPKGQILALDLSKSDSTPRVVISEGNLPITEIHSAKAGLYWRVSDAGINEVHRLSYAQGAKPEMLKLPYPANIVAVIADDASDAVVLNASSWIRSGAYLGRNATTGAIADNGLRPVGKYDRPDDLVAEEVKVKSWDGTLVPLSIVYKTGMAHDGSHPAVLMGYGAYGTSQSPEYAPFFRPLYERGMVLATCHVRGGGELGEAWHLAGFQATKPNTWKDFIACAEYLVAHKYTSPQKLAGMGGSAGGILIGRALEERPDLFAAAIAQVPAADTLRFETTANGATNVGELGTVKTEAGFRGLYAMSPYANVKNGVKYPAVLVTTGINDPRVDAWEPAKFSARLQAASASGKPVLLRVDYSGGHGIGSSMDQAVDDMADILSFALWQTGDPDFQPHRPGQD